MRLILLFSLLANCLLAQFPKHDYNWILGTNAPVADTLLGGTNINFNKNSLQITFQKLNINIDVTNGCLSDKTGDFKFHTNGIEIHNADFMLMANGDGLNPSSYRQQVEFSGYFIPQGVLPLQVDENKYVLLHEELFWGSPAPFLGTHVPHLMYTVIDGEGDNGLGEVIRKNEVIFSDTLDYGKIVATQHANGRDWWVVVPEFSLDQYYKVLVSKDTIALYDNQVIGDSARGGFGQAYFAPDGSKYVNMTLIRADLGGYVNVFDFDRCTGALSNYQRIDYPTLSGSSGGLAISPNSRFLYVFEGRYIFQYDFWADDLIASLDTVAINDNFRSPRTGFATNFFLGQLGPDNKIYISCPSSSEYLHIIHRPDEKGRACQVEQHGLELPRLNNFGIPNFPNYRLGPIDGSPCDTLGIDNLPAAHFRYTPDTTDPLSIAFTDLSYYEPATWSWAFGDGSGQSTERHPSYVFPGPGAYEVCLTVTNNNGTSTACQTLYLGVTSTEPVRSVPDWQLFPNPTRGQLTLDARALPEGEKQVFVYDLLGKLQHQQILPGGSQTIDLGQLPKGLYLVELRMEGQWLGVEKVVLE